MMGVIVRGSDRVDWRLVRDGIDLAGVATRLLGPAPGRRGERGRKLWWSCPFHDDPNPSFCVEPGAAWFKCWGCGQNGDAATLVMKATGCAFPEAVASLTGGPSPAGRPKRRTSPATVSAKAPEPPAGPEGMTEANAAAVIESAADRLWSQEWRSKVAYLTGPRRCLTPEMIRAARLGFDPSVRAATKDGRPYTAHGIVIPWYAGGRLSLVKVRQPEELRPKYAEVYRHRGIHAGIYPGPEVIRPGRPLIVVEGEFDALLLGQELGDLAPVVTLGSASARPDLAMLARMLPAAPWLVATDNDPAGDKAAGGWPASARRVRPPGSFKDWTEAKAGGVDLARWWRSIISGVETPPLFTWDELSRWRWGPGVDDPTPGIVA
jgi:CHC2 zinc finger/Toprim-like